MNTDKLMELERKWRAEVDVDPPSEYDTGWNECTVKCADELAAALRAEQAVGDEQRARELLAKQYREDGYPNTAEAILRDTAGREFDREIRAIRRALGAARQPENIGEFVIALLIAGGYVTQAKVDEARKIALGHGPYEMPARQSEGMVFGVTKVERDFRWDGDKQHHVPLLTVEFDPVLPTDGYDAKGWKDRDALATLLAAAPGGEGEVDRG